MLIDDRLRTASRGNHCGLSNLTIWISPAMVDLGSMVRNNLRSLSWRSGI